ncbi:class I SAM-dependent methyltransferase [Lysinibacillus fusiformis]|uniref:class I SAM-dependent methyltransferase n=1 Tax=Lysinibacillus fusiformis TaxID=28031 RepID=UPI001F4E3F60|nr:class I SAM-dependent methyltransferase [Lysinibacillus fusiformis]MCK1986502.1 class I SAM-dependent methyltransferase [Lysinibacillus fusiformis]
MRKCYLCSSEETILRYPQVRDNKDISVLECKNCSLVYLSTTDHITNEFYEKSGMLNGRVNLDLYRKNSYTDDKRRANSLHEKLVGKKVLDFGCGAGGFLNLIKDVADKAIGIELDEIIREQLNNEGIICYKNISETDEKFDVITLFHVLEHIPNPIELLQEIKKYLNPCGVLIIEVPNADDALLTLYDCDDFKAFTYWSCHVFLYNPMTLVQIIKKAGLQSKYVKQIQRYPLSNHLYWLSKGKPGGHKEWALLNNEVQNYERFLANIGKCDTIIIECKNKTVN